MAQGRRQRAVRRPVREAFRGATHMMTRTLLLLCVALGGSACAGKNYASAPYYEDTEFAGEMEADAAQLDGSRRERVTSRRDERGAPAQPEPALDVMASPAPAQPEGAPTTTPGNTAEPEPAVADDTPQGLARQIIYTAAMSVSVFNVEEALETVEKLPERHGGWIATMTGETLVIRIPSKNLRKAMDELSAMGVVEYRTLESSDVSDEYYDIETRIEVLERTHTQLLDLLAKARNVEEALAVRKSLDEITMELEVLKGRMRKLKDLVSYSTLTISLTERGPHTPTPSSNDPFPWVDELGVEATEWR